MRVTRILWVLCAVIALCGCSRAEQPVWETVADAYLLPANAAPAYDASIQLDGNTPLAEVFSDLSSQVYSDTEGRYEVAVETIMADSLAQLVRELTGFTLDQLDVLQRQQDGMMRYDMAWSAVSEDGNQSCRAAVIDDGLFYYVLTAQIPQELSAQCRSEVESVFQSFSLTVHSA